MIAKFEFKVSVHYGLWAKCTQLSPLIGLPFDFFWKRSINGHGQVEPYWESRLYGINGSQLAKMKKKMKKSITGMSLP